MDAVSRVGVGEEIREHVVAGARWCRRGVVESPGVPQPGLDRRGLGDCVLPGSSDRVGERDDLFGYVVGQCVQIGIIGCAGCRLLEGERVRLGFGGLHRVVESSGGLCPVGCRGDDCQCLWIPRPCVGADAAGQGGVWRWEVLRVEVTDGDVDLVGAARASESRNRLGLFLGEVGGVEMPSAGIKLRQ